MYFGLIAQNVPLVATISAILEAKQCCTLITLLFWLSWTHCKNITQKTILCCAHFESGTIPIPFCSIFHISMQISWKRGKGKKDSTTKVFAPRITDDHHLETPSEDLGILRETRDDSGKAPAYGIPAQWRIASQHKVLWNSFK